MTTTTTFKTVTLFRSLATSSRMRRIPREDEGILYPGHIPTSALQKTILALGSSVIGLSDPWRSDMVAVSGEVTAGSFQALAKIRARMASTPEGRLILEHRPRISSQTVDLAQLRNLPEGSLGRSYVNYNDYHGISPDSRAQVQFVDDEELAYVMQRYREVHDLMHAILDLPTNMVGEVLVKWVEGLQTGLPMCVGGAILGPVRFNAKQTRRFKALRPWAVQVGLNARFLMGVYFERRWDQDLGDFRREMRIADQPLI